MSDVKTFVRLPVLLDRELHPVRPLHPKPLSMNEKLRGTSEATMRLAQDEEPPALRSFVRIYTQDGDAGVYRVSSVSRSPATGETTVTLLHGRDVFSDTVILQPELAFSGNAQQLLTYALANQTHFVNDQPLWILGTVANVAVEPRTISYDRASDMLSSIESELVDYHFEYDMSGFPWELSLVANSAEVASEFRLSRNLERVSVTVNDADLCNRVIVSANHESTTDAAQDGKATPDAGKTTTVTQYFTYQDLASINEWGVCVKTADIDVGDDLAHGVHTEADAWAAKFLAMRKNPQLQIQLSGLELCRLTGCDLDRVRLGMLSCVALPDHQVWFQERVVSINRQDVLDEPERITVSMANTLPRFSESLARIRQETAANTAAARSSRRSRSVTEKEVTHWEQVVRRTWGAVDGTGLAQLHESGVVVDADQGVKIYSLIQGDQSMLGQLKVNAAAITAEVQRATGAEGTLQSNIDIEAGKITAEVQRATGVENTLSGRVSVTEAQVGMVVEKKDGTNVIKAASIVAEINKTTGDSNAIIQADHVYLDANKTANIGNSFFMSNGQIWIKKAVMIGESSHVTFNNGTMNAPTVQVNSGGALKFSPSSQSGTVISIDHAKASGLLTEVQIAQPASGSNTYTLQYKKVGGGDTWFTPANGTFSRAIASWTAVAGNGAVTMTANPQGQSLIHVVKPILVNNHIRSNFTSNVYKDEDKAANLINGIQVKLVANTTNGTVEAQVDDTAVAELPVSFAGNVTLGNWEWNSYTGNMPSTRTVSIAASDSGGGADSASLSMTLSQGAWGGASGEGLTAHQKYVSLVAPATNGSARARVLIDAGQLVSGAPVSGSWDADTQTFTAAVDTSGTSQTASTKVLLTVQKASTTSSLNDKLDVLVHHDSVTGTNLIANKRVTLSANNTAAAALSNTNTTRTGTAKVRAGISSTYYAEFGHTIAVDGGSDIATAGGTSDVTFSLDGVVVGRKRVKATYAGDASGNVDLSSMAAGSGNVTYTQDTRGSYVSLPVDYTLSNGTTGTKPVNTVKFPFGVTLTPSKSGSNLAVSATVPGTSGTLTVNSGSYAVSNLYTLTEKTAAQLNDASTGNRLDGAVGTVINGNLSYSTAYTGMGRVWANPAAVSGHTDQMTITSCLSNATSTSASHYAKKETTIALSADKATLDPGEAATISAKVGTGTYASVAVSARAVNLKPLTITPTTEVQTIPVPSGYDGHGTITVNAAAATGGDLTAWSWTDSGSSKTENTVSTSIDGTTTKKEIKLVLTQNENWDAAYQKRVYLRDTSTQGNLHASIVVDALSAYNAGATYGYARGVNDGIAAAGGGGGTPTPTGHSISVTADGTDISKQSNGTYVDKSGNTVTVNADFALGAGHNKRFKITCGTATYYIRVTPT